MRRRHARPAEDRSQRRRNRSLTCAHAVEADRNYAAKAPEQGLYRLFISQNHHTLTYAVMMIGPSAVALKTIREMVADITLDFFRENAWADGLMASPLEVLMRFGRWDESLATPLFPDFAPTSRSVQHDARGLPRREGGPRKRSEGVGGIHMEARTRLAKEATLGNNSGSAVLDVAEYLMKGQVLFSSEKVDEGLAAMRGSVVREDKLQRAFGPAPTHASCPGGRPSSAWTAH